MSFKKPINYHPKLEKNNLGLTRRDYEGAVSTLCAGCGHDSISACIIESCFKSFARSIKQALAVDHRIINQIPSSKGML